MSVVWLGRISVRFCRLDTGINECVDALWRISELAVILTGALSVL